MSKYDVYDRMSDDLIKRVNAGMGCGSYVLDGWADIINNLNGQVAFIDPHYKVDQIKEKLGGLRYYVKLSEGLSELERDTIHRLIQTAENKSMETCDVCGEPGIMANQSRGYIATRCEEHTS